MSNERARQTTPLPSPGSARRTALLAAALLGIAAPACDKEEEKKKDAAAEEDEGPAIKVNLPPSPDFDEGKAPDAWEDGSKSIYAMRQDLDASVQGGAKGTEIQIKGYVQDVYIAPECPEGDMCAPPKQAHVWVTDHPDTQGKKRAMMVVNYEFPIPEWDAKRWKDEPPVLLEKGKRYTFKGKFKQFSDTGFSDARGLLEFIAYRPLDPETGQELQAWVYPPNSSWHPLEIARQQEANAALVEKSKETAAPQ